jgi:unsaturated rhamnogalacturonyl hydrolase
MNSLIMRRSKAGIQIIIGLCSIMLTFAGCKQEKKENLEMPQEKQLAVSDTLKWSERMALSVMKRNPKAFQIDGKEEPKWDYVHGLVLTGFEKLYEKSHNKKYYDYVIGYADTLIDSSGTIATYKFSNYNIDMIEAGKLLFGLYDNTKDVKYLKAMQLLRKQLEEHPRTSEGGFWHKKIYPNQMWLDGLYMGAPFYARYTVEFENGKNLDDVAKQFELIQKHSRDEKTGLLYHGWDESKQMDWANKETGTSPNFWSRSLGWYAMALVDVLDYFPKDHPKQPELVGYLNQLAEALTKFQAPSGLWYQVTDMGGKEGNYLESTGTSMFAYALAKGVNKGYLPTEYLEVANTAFDGLTRDLIKVADDGEITITQACAVAGLGGNPYRDGSYEYYVNERKKDNDPKATGPFILAALELDK